MKANQLGQQAKFRGIPISTHQNAPKQAKLRTKARFNPFPYTHQRFVIIFFPQRIDPGYQKTRFNKIQQDSTSSTRGIIFP